MRPDGARQVFVNVITAWGPDTPSLGFDDDWTRNLVFVHDGGSEHWQFLFDPASDTLSSIRTNGEGRGALQRPIVGAKGALRTLPQSFPHSGV